MYTDSRYIVCYFEKNPFQIQKFTKKLYSVMNYTNKCCVWLSSTSANSFARINMIIKVFFSKQRPAFWIYRHIHTHPVVNKTLWFITQRLGVQLHEISIYTPSINEIIETTTYFICLEKRNRTNVFEYLVTSCISIQNVSRLVS